MAARQDVYPLIRSEILVMTGSFCYIYNQAYCGTSSIKNKVFFYGLVLPHVQNQLCCFSFPYWNAMLDLRM